MYFYLYIFMLRRFFRQQFILAKTCGNCLYFPFIRSICLYAYGNITILNRYLFSQIAFRFTRASGLVFILAQGGSQHFLRSLGGFIKFFLSLLHKSCGHTVDELCGTRAIQERHPGCITHEATSHKRPEDCVCECIFFDTRTHTFFL